jgi:hypothetical protein
MGQAADKFFKMFRSRERLDAIESMLQTKCGNTYSVFWKSLRKHLEEIADTRNEIVHWHIAHPIIFHKTHSETHYELIPPTFWAMIPYRGIGVNDLWEFVDKCRAIFHYCNALRLLIDDDPKLTFFEPHLLKPYQDLCQKEIEYPIPEGHLLATEPKPA